ncbi:MAG TPA: cytochrome c oxidase assembly protein [Ktedonobacterales bacterium]|jgi:cytochrome c oxidase assembly factor CtaG
MIFGALPLWLAWNFEPIPLIAVALPAIAYAWAISPAGLRWYGRETPVEAKYPRYFYAGIAALALALFSPLDILGMHFLLTAHMIQHVFFSVIGPPLLLLGIPGWMVEPFFRGVRAQRVGRFLTHPVVAFGLYNLNMWVWHVPFLLDATPSGGVIAATELLDYALLLGALLIAGFLLLPRLLRAGNSTVSLAASVLVFAGIIALTVVGSLSVANWPVSSQPHNPVHTVMNLMFIGTAILYWCPILNPVPQLPRITPVFGMLYMFISTQPMMALGALIVFSGQPLYSIYAGAPSLWGFTPLGDQQLAGLIMWLIMDIPLIVTITILFFRWMASQERAQREIEALAHPEDELIWQTPKQTPEHASSHASGAD